MIPEAIMTKKTRKLTSPYPLINKQQRYIHNKTIQAILNGVNLRINQILFLLFIQTYRKFLFWQKVFMCEKSYNIKHFLMFSSNKYYFCKM